LNSISNGKRQELRSLDLDLLGGSRDLVPRAIDRKAKAKLRGRHECRSYAKRVKISQDLAPETHLTLAVALGDKINQCRVLRDVIPPTPPGPEGSNGNGLVRAQ